MDGAVSDAFGAVKLERKSKGKTPKAKVKTGISRHRRGEWCGSFASQKLQAAVQSTKSDAEAVSGENHAENTIKLVLAA